MNYVQFVCCFRLLLLFLCRIINLFELIIHTLALNFDIELNNVEIFVMNFFSCQYSQLILS